MPSRDFSEKRSSGAAEPLVSAIPDQRRLRPEPPVRSVDEFVAFLAEVEAVVGRDERPRPPTTGVRFLL